MTDGGIFGHGGGENPPPYMGKPRGPYGTNIGDTWYASDALNEMIKADKGPEWAILIYVKDDGTGKPIESVFSTKNPELIEKARLGTISWAKAHARLN